MLTSLGVIRQCVSRRSDARCLTVNRVESADNTRALPANIYAPQPYFQRGGGGGFARPEISLLAYALTKIDISISISTTMRQGGGLQISGGNIRTCEMANWDALQLQCQLSRFTHWRRQHFDAARGSMEFRLVDASCVSDGRLNYYRALAMHKHIHHMSFRSSADCRHANRLLSTKDAPVWYKHHACYHRIGTANKPSASAGQIKRANTRGTINLNKNRTAKVRGSLLTH